MRSYLAVLDVFLPATHVLIMAVAFLATLPAAARTYAELSDGPVWPPGCPEYQNEVDTKVPLQKGDLVLLIEGRDGPRQMRISRDNSKNGFEFFTRDSGSLNSPPNSLFVGTSGSFNVGSPVVFYVFGSDPDGDPTTVSFEALQLPAGSQAAPPIPVVDDPNRWVFTPDTEGGHFFRFGISDGINAPLLGCLFSEVGPPLSTKK